MKRLFQAVTALLLLPGLLSGQNVSVDQGAFRILLNGEMAGREEFSIRQIGGGESSRLVLRGQVEISLPEGRQERTAAMEAEGEEMALTAYQLRASGPTSSEIYVTRSGRRFLARVISVQGEEVREFRAGPGSVLLDKHIAHHHHLLLPFLDREQVVSLSVLSPSAGEQIRMTLRFQGEEEVRVGTELIQGGHFRLEGGEGPREIWFDNQGRVLRVEIPSNGYVAERESLG